MKTFLELQVANILVGRYTPMLSKLFLAVVATIVTWLLSVAPEHIASNVDPVMVAGILYWLLDLLATYLAAGPLKKYATQIQRVLNQLAAAAKVDAPPLELDGKALSLTAGLADKIEAAK